MFGASANNSVSWNFASSSMPLVSAWPMLTGLDTQRGPMLVWRSVVSRRIRLSMSRTKALADTMPLRPR